MENNFGKIKRYKCQWDQSPPELSRWSSELKGRSYSSIDAPYLEKNRSNLPKFFNNSVDFDIKRDKFNDSNFMIYEEDEDGNSEVK